MDKFQGVTLKKILKNKVELDLNICSCLLIDQKVIKEISEIYDKGIRHRDLKSIPSNILFDLERKRKCSFRFWFI